MPRRTLCYLLALLPGLSLACSPKPDARLAAAAATRESEALSRAHPTTAPQPAAQFDSQLETEVFPPADWTLDPPKITPQHVHKTWISPDRLTAYGVIRFKLPLPVSDDLALWGFLREMRASEGEAILLEKRRDPDQPGLFFAAEGGKYLVRGHLTVRGFRGWCVYAGTLRNKPINPDDLQRSLQSRALTNP
jgi:hypothetical protein